MTLAVLGAFAEGKTTIRNVYNWRVKETERMVAMVIAITIDYCHLSSPLHLLFVIR